MTYCNLPEIPQCTGRASIIEKVVIDRIDKLLGARRCQNGIGQSVAHEQRGKSELNSQDSRVLYISNYTSVIVIDSASSKDYDFVVCLNPLQPDLYTSICELRNDKVSIRASLGGNEYIIDLNYVDDALVGTIPSGLFTCAKTVKVEFFVMSNHIEPIYVQLTHNLFAEGPFLKSIPLTFTGSHKPSLRSLKGAQKDEILARLENDAHGLISAHCTPYEVEALSGWSLLRLLELHERPTSDGLFPAHETLSSMTNDRNLEPHEQLNTSIPADIKRLSALQVRNRPQYPIRFNEFKDILDQIKVVSEGQNAKECGSFFENSKAITALLDPCRGQIPLPLKSSLFLGLSGVNRRIVERYHASIFKCAVEDGRVVNLFMRNRPSDAKITVISFVLHHDPTRACEIPMIERLEATEDRLGEPRYWRFIDEIKPQKNILAAKLSLTRYILDNFPTMQDKAGPNDCELAPGVKLYVESYPDQLKSAELTDIDCRYAVCIRIDKLQLYTLSGVSFGVLEFILGPWLSHVKFNKKSALLHFSDVN